MGEGSVCAHYSSGVDPLEPERRLSAKEMDGENMVPSTSVVTFDSEGSSLVLHGEVISNGP